MAHPQNAGFQRGVIAVVGAVTGDEVFDQAGEGVGFELVVRDQHGVLATIPGDASLPRGDRLHPRWRIQSVRSETSDCQALTLLPDSGRSGCPPWAPGYRTPSGRHVPAGG